MLTMRQLTADLIATLEINRNQILKNPYIDDTVMECVDSAIPVYHYQLTELLLDNPRLGNGPEDYGLVPHNPTVWNIITAAVFEKLSEAAHDWLQKLS